MPFSFAHYLQDNYSIQVNLCTRVTLRNNIADVGGRIQDGIPHNRLRSSDRIYIGIGATHDDYSMSF